MEADRIILGNSPKAVYSTDCSVTGVNNNVIVCAGTGGGKTMSITEPRLLTAYDTNLIVTCTKRKIVDKYSGILKERGYSILDMNFTDPEASNICYDPMKFIKNDTDIRFIAQSIVLANPRKEVCNQDPYWDDTAIILLCAVISCIRNTRENPTFTDVLDILDNLEITGSEDTIETNMDHYFDSAKGDKYCKCQWNTFRTLPERTARCVLSTLTSSINTVFTPDLREMIKSKKNINFQNFAENKTVLFISTSAVNPALNCFINMFYSELFKDLFEYAEKRPDKKLPHPVSVIADDFATGSRIQNFPEYISIFREKLISVVILLQSETQLMSMYGHYDACSIINNCDTYVYLGGMDIATCERVSKRADRPLDDILNLPVGKAVIFRRGQKPLYTERYQILEDETYIQITKEYEKQIEDRKKRLENKAASIRNSNVYDTPALPHSKTDTKKNLFIPKTSEKIAEKGTDEEIRIVAEHESEPEVETTEVVSLDKITALYDKCKENDTVLSPAINGPVISEEFVAFMQQRIEDFSQFESSLNNRLIKLDKKTADFYKDEIKYTKMIMDDFIIPYIGTHFFTAAINLSETSMKLYKEWRDNGGDREEFMFAGQICELIPYVEAYLSEFYRTIFLEPAYDSEIYMYYCEKKDKAPLKPITGFEKIQEKINYQWLIRSTIYCRKNHARLKDMNKDFGSVFNNHEADLKRRIKQLERYNEHYTQIFLIKNIEKLNSL